MTNRTNGSVRWARVVYALLASAVVFFWRPMYDAADKHGWFPHRRMLNVWMSDDWLVGEFKTCFLTSDSLEAGGSKEVSLLLSCDESVLRGQDVLLGHNVLRGQDVLREHKVPPHKMNVEFRGSLHAIEAGGSGVFWNCQRKEDSISCKAK